jgi:hypothetical protein
LSAIAKPQLFGVRPSNPAPKHATDFVRPLAGGSSPRALKRLQEFCKNFLKGGLETGANFARGLLRRASRMNFGGGGRDSARGFLQVNAPAAGAPSRRRAGYNARVDRLDAIRLLKALVAAGAKPRAPMDSAWIDEIAVRDVSLHGTQLASALAYAEGQRWLADSRTRKDWIYLTRTGEIVAKESVI